MTVQKFSADDEAPLSLWGRVAIVGGHVRRFASSEVGGWLIVSVLALVAIGFAGASWILPRLNAAPPPREAPLSQSAQAAGQTPLGDMVDFTLAPEAVQDMDFAEARLWNAALPFSTAPIRPAAPLIAPTTDVEAYSRAVDCLTAAVYYEAASETAQGQAAVAQVVLNRARHPAYPRTICGVVFQGSERTTGCQFSFTCDGAMARVPSVAGWARARQVATAALNGNVVRAVGTATHYHTDWVAPYWAPRLSKIVQIGTHIFYRWNGAWGLPTAFTGAYSGAEPIIPKMAALTTFAAPVPVEIMAVSETPSLNLDDAGAPRSLAPVLVAVSPAESETADSETLSTAEVAPVAPIRSAAPVLQRDRPIVADPLASPTAAPTRQRQRIAAPSGW